MKTPDAIAELLRAGRFALVGLCATGVHMVVAQAVLAQGDLNAVGANLAGFVAAFLAALFGHYHFTFASSAPFWRAFRRYGVVALAGFLVNNVVLIVLKTGGYVSESVALTIAILIIPIGTFLGSRFWGFVAPAER